MKLNIQKTLRRQRDVQSVLASTEEEGRVIAKMSLDKEGEIKLDREYKNQMFLVELSQKEDLGFDFLKPQMKENILIYPYLNNVQWLADDEFKSIAAPEEYLDSVFRLEKKLHSLEKDDIPKEIIKDSEERNETRSKNLEKDLEYVSKNGIVVDGLPNDILSIIRSGIEDVHYQHHDVVPWHMAQSGDRLILIDPGWAGLSFKYYDLAYLMLQLVGYGGKKKDADMIKHKVKEEFGREDNFEVNFKASLLYRYLKLSRELYEQGAMKSLEQLNSFVKNAI